MPASGSYGSTRSIGMSTRRSGALIIAIAACLGLVDIALASRSINIAPLYMIPMILGAQHLRRSTSVLWLAIALILLDYIGFGSAWLLTNHDAASLVSLKVFRILNRGFVAVAIAGSTIIAVFYIRLRDYWLARQAQLAPSEDDVNFFLHVFQTFEDIISCIIAMAIAGITFYVDLSCPREYNLAILHLVPLAVLAITRNRYLIWCAVPVLVTLAYVGFVFGPGSDLSGLTFAVTVNRSLAITAMIVAAVLFHITGTKVTHAAIVRKAIAENRTDAATPAG